MPRLIVLLRGVNLVSTNRVAMPELRSALADAGYENARTYVQSGNVVLASKDSPAKVASTVKRLIADRFGLTIGVVVRTRDELAGIVAQNPLEAVATDPRRSQVTFLDGEPDLAAVDKLEAAAVGGERVVHIGRELYTWHPDGLGRSKLGRLLAGKELGVTATTRNWRTVSKLLELADQ